MGPLVIFCGKFGPGKSGPGIFSPDKLGPWCGKLGPGKVGPWWGKLGSGKLGPWRMLARQIRSQKFWSQKSQMHVHS